MHKTAVNTLVLIALVLLFSTSAYATGLNASIRTNYPDGNYFFTDEPISVMLTMWDDNGDPLYADEAATNGLEIVELWLAGPKQDYFAVEPYSRRIIVDPENGYVCDHDLEGSRGEYMMYDQEYPDLLGTYSIIFKCQRQVDGNTITVYPRVDYLLGQNRPTSSQAARYLSCSTCHLSYGRHGNSNIDDCLLCHSNDRPWAFSSTMHNLHTSDNCLLCHRAGGGIGNYSATACYTCHTMPGSHSSYEDSDCSNCHSGGFSVYSRHDIDEPHQPSSFSLLSPPNETEIDCDSLVVSWTPSNDSDEGDMISYEIEVAIDTDFENVVVYDAGSENEYTIHEIEENLCYYWRVLANDLNSEGRYSTQTWNFNGPMSVVNEDEKLPEDFKISRVYPNPFNASVSVEVEINRSRDLNFRFFNSAGQTVLESKQMGLPNGEHTFSFNLKHLSSGIYFVQLESMGVSSRVEKILLIK